MRLSYGQYKQNSILDVKRGRERVTMSTYENGPEASHRWYSQVYGGWLGKSIGGTLGMPYEGEMRLLDVSGYDPTISLPAANDDLDLQLVNLHALEQHGPRLRALHLGYEWLEHVFFPFDEYGYALANMRRGLVPPLAGWFNNPFIDCMGAPIRSELWGMLVPGQPAIAAYYAWQDAQVDHAGGEGMYGEMFFAAIESQAFIENDRERLLACGLQYIPEDCRVARAVRHAIECHTRGLTWQESRESILTHFGHTNFTDTPQNVAFTIIGWLYGADFGDAVLIAINCGYDTDCTGATLGAILGIIAGESGIPAHWSEPIGNRIAVSEPIRFLDAPSNLEELTERTLYVAHEAQALWQNQQVATRLQKSMREERDAFASHSMKLQGTGNLLVEDTVAISVAFENSAPVIGSGQSTSLLITLANLQDLTWQGTLALQVPAGWSGPDNVEIQLEPLATRTYVQKITANDILQYAYEVTVCLTRSYQGVSWKTLALPVALVPASHWEIVGLGSDKREEAIVAGNVLVLPSQLNDYTGLVSARTRIENPCDRTVRWIIVAQSAIQVWLDGEHVLTTSSSQTALPAFHRAEAGSFCECFMSAGSHELELVFSRDAQSAGDERIMVLPVAASEVQEPGPYYYLTDMLFAPPLTRARRYQESHLS